MYTCVMCEVNGVLLSSSWNYDLGNLSLGQVGKGELCMAAWRHSHSNTPLLAAIPSCMSLPPQSLGPFNFHKSLLGLKEGILLALDTEFPFKTRLSKVF